MRDLPPPVLEYLRTLIVDNRSLAYLQIDKRGCLSNWGGNLAAYGMTGLRKGLPVGEQVVFLEGLFPLQDSPLLLPCVETGSGLFADIHILSGEDGNWVLLLDATPEEVQRRLFHQKANDLSLRYEQQSKLLEQYAYGAAHESLLIEAGGTTVACNGSNLTLTARRTVWMPDHHARNFEVETPPDFFACITAGCIGRQSPPRFKSPNLPS